MFTEKARTFATGCLLKTTAGSQTRLEKGESAKLTAWRRYEKTNLEITKTILKLMGFGFDKIEFVKDSPGTTFMLLTLARLGENLAGPQNKL